MKKIFITILLLLLAGCSRVEHDRIEQQILRDREIAYNNQSIISSRRFEGNMIPDNIFIDKKYNVICYWFKTGYGGGLGCANILEPKQ